MHLLLYLLYFPIVAALAFFLPGHFFVKRLKLTFFDEIAASIVVGIVLLVFQAYLFGLLGFRQLTYLYLAFFVIVFLKDVKLYIHKIPRKISVNFADVVLVFVGLLFLISAVWFMGAKTNDGLFFCCRGVPDALYHLSLTNSLISSFPAQEPGMDGVLVKNYHFFSNLVSAEISRTFLTPLIETQFRFLNVVLALLLLIFPFSFSKLLNLGKHFARILTILLFSSGDILYLLLFIRGKGLDFGTTIVDDLTKLLAGPPRAFSVVILFWGIYFLCVWLNKRSWLAYSLSCLFFASLVGFKIYTAFFALSGLGAVSAFYLIKKRFKNLLAPVAAALITLGYHFQFNKEAGGLIFNGLWRFENFSQHKDLLISKLDFVRMQSIENDNYLLTYFIWLVLIISYFLFLFGTANFAFFQTKKSIRNVPIELTIFIVSGIFSSLVLGSFFLQKTGGANTIQFLIGAYIVALIPASLSIVWLFQKIKKPLNIVFLIVVLTFSSARGVHEVVQNFFMIAHKESFIVRNRELDAMDYLRKNTANNATIAVEPWAAEDQPFMYISFLSGRQMFLLGGGVLRDHGHDVSERQKVNNEIYSSSNPIDVRDLLYKNSIEYLYLTPGINLSVGDTDYLIKAYDKDGIRILKLR